MPFILPFFLLLISPIALAVIWVLASLPAFPRRRKIQILWVALLSLLSGFLIYNRFFSQPRVAWHPPARAEAVDGFLIFLPFAVSAFLWWKRRDINTSFSASTSTLLVVVVCLSSFFAMKQFNRSCVFYDAWHDEGHAWCAEAWQATFGR